MKNPIPVMFILIMMFSLNVQAQDTIYFQSHEKEIAKILEINPSEVVYRKMSYLDGPVFRSLKTQIDSIRFANGMKEVLGSVAAKQDSVPIQIPPKVVVSERESYAQGVSDADHYYKGHRGIGTACYISGLFYYVGLPVPIVGSITRPNNMMRYVPDRNRYDTDTPYFNGFNTRSRTIRANKVWANYGYGAATTTGLILILLVSALSTIQ